MGEVYKARDNRLERIVAIKVLPHDKVSDPERKRRFLQEARTVSALNHPNIVTLHDIASDGGVDYLVMEYVPGKSLAQLITAKALALEEVLDYAEQIASALVAAHAAGIVHRDIKPANVIVTPQSQVKVLDFGLAKLSEPAGTPASMTRTLEPALTGAGMVLGTVAYMPPEQARAEKVDARSDLFSFGAVLYEMATGRRAFPKPLDWTRPPVPRVHPELDRMVLKLVESDRDLRYQTAADVVADLKRLRASREAGISRRRWLWSVGSAGGAAVAVWGAIQWRSIRRGRRLSDGNRSSSNREANEYYERALLFGGAGVEDSSQRLRMLERALALDPRFAAARAEYAFSFVVMILKGDSNDPNLFYRTEEQIRQALQDDPGCGRAHSVLALTYLLQGQKELVPTEVDKALKANPDDVTAYTWLLEYHRLNGDYAQAVALARQIISRWPLYWPGHLYLGMVLQEQGDTEGAIREQERVLEQDAQNVAALAELARAYMDTRNLAKARQILERARPSDRANYDLRLKWGLLLAAEAKGAEAIQEMDGQVQTYAGISAIRSMEASEFYALLGEPTKALEWLDKAVRANDDRAEWWGRDPLLASLRKHPRFGQMLAFVAHRREQRPRDAMGR
jgi:serine/threonine protein kinase/Tfp pilus assembly protein PilF